MRDEEAAYEEIRKRYVEKLRETLHAKPPPRTRHYQEFRREYLPKPLSWYERWCTGAEKLLPIDPDKKRAKKLEEAIATCHLQVTPRGVSSFALLVPILLMISGAFLFFVIPRILWGGGNLFITFYVAIISLIIVLPLGRIPDFLATSWRMRASNQMVLCIFYIVTYMRHTSNLELAIDFAAEHLAPPLSLDMKKIIWDLETEKFDSLKESLEHYLKRWRGYNDEFIEAVHLVESSLVESAESRRLDALDKALSVMLEETYEKMLHYAHNLKGPLTTLHMLGIILPILGLVILPLIVSFEPSIRWYHLFLLYNVTLPLLVYLLGKDILSKRPTGYGSTDIEETLVRRRVKSLSWGRISLTPLFAASLVMILLFAVGALPLLIHAANPDLDLVTREGRGEEEGCILGFCAVDVKEPEETRGARLWFNEYRDVVIDKESGETIKVGPFGLVATLLSVFIPLGLGAGAGVYYKLRSRDAEKLRRQAKKLEMEFASALFQLGNRLADGLPLEIAFSKVAALMPNTISGRFFNQVSANITRMGLSVEDAIFHEEFGALHRYPSNLIESSMKVLVESARKGPLIASQAIINVSNYLKEMHRVDERLRDLLADVISSMKSQVSFLAPSIAGIVIGITSMILSVLGRISTFTKGFGDLDAGGMGSWANLLDSVFGGGAVPTYFFQAIVGVYIVELIYILTIFVNGIENGSDKTMEHSLLGKNLVRSTATYAIIAFIVILLFNIVSVRIIETTPLP